MDDATAVGVLQSLADLIDNAQRLVQGEAMVLGLPEQPLQVAARHMLADDVGLAVFIADVEDGDDIGVIPKAAHGLGFATDTGQAVGIEALGLDDGDGHIAVQLGVVRQVDALASALAQEPLDLIAAAGE